MSRVTNEQKEKVVKRITNKIGKISAVPLCECGSSTV